MGDVQARDITSIDPASGRPDYVSTIVFIDSRRPGMRAYQQRDFDLSISAYRRVPWGEELWRTNRPIRESA